MNLIVYTLVWIIMGKPTHGKNNLLAKVDRHLKVSSLAIVKNFWL